MFLMLAGLMGIAMVGSLVDFSSEPAGHDEIDDEPPPDGDDAPRSIEGTPLDHITAGGGDTGDDLAGDGDDDDALAGDAGNDTLVGSADPDWLSGGDGNDQLNG